MQQRAIRADALERMLGEVLALLVEELGCRGYSNNSACVPVRTKTISSPVGVALIR